MKPPRPTPPTRRVGLISLGCAKNLVDAEIMLGSLLQQGVEIVNDPAEADAVIVNTCSFIDTAQEESVDTILESAQVREAGQRGQALIVAGCLPQRFRDELPKLLPEVDAFMGIDQVTQVGEIVEAAVARRRAKLRAAGAKRPSPRGSLPVKGRLAELDRARPDPAGGAPDRLAGSGLSGPTRRVVAPGRAAPPGDLAPLLDVATRPKYIPHWDTPRFRLTPRHFAYVKIAEGCNHPCSFCIIPRMRGGHRSRPQSDLVEEARRLIADGARELNLISQDSTYYGLDLRPGQSRAIASPTRFRAAAEALPRDATTLCTLLRELNALEGEFWIRLLYTHPAHWTEELIRTMADCRKVARYVDMPLQHIHDAMLERMRRETSRAYIEDLIRRLRAGVPGIAVRTTFIVGFPGETDAYFDALLEFIRATRFERLGVFTYSQEAGTIAGRMANQVPDEVKERRRELAMAAQRAVAQEAGARSVGQTLRVLVDGPADARQLRQANVLSWEHGFVRQPENSRSKLGAGQYAVARGEADAPDIDGRVYVRGRLAAGEFVAVNVIGHTDYDLVAQVA